MYRFWDLVTEPLLSALEPSCIVEIGSDEGFHTRLLLEFCQGRGGVVHVVDPLPKYEISEWRKRYGETLVFHKSLSLDALPDIEKPDLVLIDGDHNWYTVFNELKVLERNAENGDFPLVLLHDVGWPYGRRDLYYDPDSIPQDHRQPYEREGMERGKSELIPGGGLNTHFYNATHEGGDRNGVLTAVEDFVSQSDISLELFVLPVIFGLGILVPKTLMDHNESVEKVIRPFRELENGRSIRDDLLEIVETDRIAAEKTRAEAEKARTMAETRAATELEDQRKKFEKKVRHEEIRVQRLLRWMLLLNELFSEVLASRQWKAGKALKDAYRRVSRRPEGSSAAQGMTEIFKEFSDWRERNNVKRKPDLAYDVRNAETRKGRGQG